MLRRTGRSGRVAEVRRRSRQEAKAAGLVPAAAKRVGNSGMSVILLFIRRYLRLLINIRMQIQIYMWVDCLLPCLSLRRIR